MALRGPQPVTVDGALAQRLADFERRIIQLETASATKASDGTTNLQIQTGTFSIPGFGGGAFSTTIELPTAWANAHVAFLASSAISHTVNKSWDVGGEVVDLTKGRIRGSEGPNFEGAFVTWVSLGY